MVLHLRLQVGRRSTDALLRVLMALAAISSLGTGGVVAHPTSNVAFSYDAALNFASARLVVEHGLASSDRRPDTRATTLARGAPAGGAYVVAAATEAASGRGAHPAPATP